MTDQFLAEASRIAVDVTSDVNNDLSTTKGIELAISVA